MRLDLSNIQFIKQDIKRDLKLPIKITTELAYFCGVLAGDGNINVRYNKDYAIKCVGNPKDEIEFYQEIIEPLIYRLFHIKIKSKFCDKRTTYGFVIWSKTIVRFLNEIIGLPIGIKYNKLKIPNLFKQNKEFIISFLQGVADTDGSFSLKKNHGKIPYYPVINISSKSKNFIEEISEELKKLDIKFCKTLNYKKIDERLKQGFSIINRIDIHGRSNVMQWMNKISFKHPKHLKKFEILKNLAGVGIPFP